MRADVLRYRENLWDDCHKPCLEILFGIILGRQYAQKKWLSCLTQEETSMRAKELCHFVT